MTLVPLPAFADNTLWTLQDGRNAIVKDRQQAGPMFDMPVLDRLPLAAILVTRRRRDPGLRHQIKTHP